MSTHLITGAGSGIGAAIGRRLHERGDDLVLLARSHQRAAELAGQFPGASTLIGDLSDPERLADALSEQQLPDALDSLLHIAGTVDLGTVAELTVTAWLSQLAINVVAPAELTRLLLPQLPPR